MRVSAVVERLRGALPPLVRELVRDARDDDLVGEAAKMAYFFFLSLFPALIVVFTLTGLLGGDAAFARIASALEAAAPEGAWPGLRRFLREVTAERRPNVLSLGLLLLLWAGSTGIAALAHALNVVYDLKEQRPWLRRRILALGVLVAGTVLVVGGAVALFWGFGLLRAFEPGAAWRIARWPLGVLLVVTAIWLAYRYLPNRDAHAPVTDTLAGAGTATALWILATYGFSFYVSNVRNYSRLYGAIGAVIVLLVWFYLSALAVLIGGELAAGLERRRHGTAKAREGRARPT